MARWCSEEESIVCVWLIRTWLCSPAPWSHSPDSKGHEAPSRHKFSTLLAVFILPTCLINSPAIPDPVTHNISHSLSHLQPIPSLFPFHIVLCVIAKLSKGPRHCSWLLDVGFLPALFFGIHWPPGLTCKALSVHFCVPVVLRGFKYL